jgi:hypothetical protein
VELGPLLKVTAPPARNSADPTHERGLVFRVATATSSGQATAADIPANCRGRYWRILSVGANTQWAWVCDEDGVGGVDTVPTLVYNQASATGTGHLAAAGTLVDGVERSVWCPANARRVVFISSATGGFFEGELSGGRTV